MPSAIGPLPHPSQLGDASLASSLGTGRPLAKAAPADGPAFVAPVRTPITTDQAQALIGQALEHVTGEKPRPETVAILTAQWAHETGRGASMFNYNFAGIKGAGPSGLSVMQRTREGYGATERTITDGFRAYQTAEEGAHDYVKLLASRFPGALEAARQGDPQGTVHALKQAGYFTGDEVAYTRSVSRIAQELGPALDFATPELPTLPIEYASGFAAGRGGGDGVAPVDPMAFSEHIVRAALRIMSSAGEEDRESLGAIT